MKAIYEAKTPLLTGTVFDEAPLYAKLPREVAG